MQIFLLSQTSEENASWYMDKHVVKTPTQIVQILLNSCARLKLQFPQLKNYSGMPMMPSFALLNTPFVRWASLHPANYNWVLEMGLDLCKEYRIRCHENHYLLDSLLQFKIQETKDDPLFDRYPWMIPMAFQNRDAGILESYRRYYIEAKNHLAVWSKPRDVPYWYPLEAVLEGRKIAQVFRHAQSTEGLVVDGMLVKLPTEKQTN